MIFCGIWYGNVKPDTNILMSLCVKQFREAYKGFNSRDDLMHLLEGLFRHLIKL
jgi:hypothetical protein